MEEIVDIEPILAVECDDCGISLILDASFLSIFELDNEYMGATICFHCERPIVNYIEKYLVDILVDRGVKILSWGEQ